jgi:hypothetical protein
MIGLQLIAIIFALWMMYFSYLHYRRGEFNRIEFALWQVLWLGLLVVVIMPKSVQFLLNAFSITRAFDLVVIVGIVILFGITFRNYVIIKRLERKIEDSVRQHAIRDAAKDERQ